MCFAKMESGKQNAENDSTIEEGLFLKVCEK
jgi:hypothetical protein